MAPDSSSTAEVSTRGWIIGTLLSVIALVGALWIDQNQDEEKDWSTQ